MAKKKVVCSVLWREKKSESRAKRQKQTKKERRTRFKGDIKQKKTQANVAQGNETYNTV